jgi:hypothetical protein
VGPLVGLLALAACGGTSNQSIGFTAKDAGFSATFPRTPTRTVKSDPTAGQQILYEAQSATTSEDVLVQYAAIAVRSPGVDNKLLLDQQIDGSAQAVSGTVTSRQSTTVAGQPAEDGVIASAKGQAIRMRAFFIPNGQGEKYYVISGGAPSVDSPHPAYDRLIATFKLTS